MYTSDALELPNMTVETIRLQIESFFTKLTAEQWNLLKSGTPDDATRLLMAELLLNMTSSVSSDLVTARGHEDINVQSSLEDALRQSLSPVSLTKSVVLDQLTELVAEEITDRLNSRLTASSTSGPSTSGPSTSRPRQCHHTSADKLEKMVQSLCKVSNKYSSDIEGLIKEKTIVSRTASSSGPSGSDRSRTSDHSVSSSGTSEAVQEIIGKEVSDIMESLVDEMSESDLSGLIYESSLEFTAAKEEIYQIISEEESVKLSDPSRSSKSSKSNKKFWKGLGKNIKKLLTKVFATAWMLKIVAQVKKSFKKKTKVQSRESIKGLLDSVESLCLTDTRGEGVKVSSQRVQIVSPENFSILKQELTDVIYKFITAEDLEVSVSVPESQRETYAAIEEKVSNFLRLMNWWFTNQADESTDRMTSALMEMESIKGSPVLEINRTEEPAVSREKMYVRLLIDQLVTRVYAEAKMDWYGGGPADLTRHLFEKTWAEVKDLDLDTFPGVINVLHKAVFKDLCKTWACPEMLLLSICNKEPEVETRIAASMKRHMSKKTRLLWILQVMCGCCGGGLSGRAVVLQPKVLNPRPFRWWRH
ncbi:unnamed protein product [Pleuronectes platessa]|uniref:Uncharacterized protein n=1 Tax=Pleuronectes platessa TaxID=8262 RepID=A0A9N7Z6P1_PLEPL|nr:unnamed protein product [Pleuronectes platessa]